MDNVSLSGRMVYKIADTFIVQHKELLEKYPKAKIKEQKIKKGRLLGDYNGKEKLKNG